MQLINRLRNNTSGWLVFTKELLQNPQRLGAACPSSPRLAALMAKQISTVNQDTVVELGAGTGVVTNALLKQNIKESQLILVEKSQVFYDYLSRQFPNINLICGDALKLSNLLTDKENDIAAVVSSLPLRLFLKEQVNTLHENIFKILKPGGLYVQFTYDLRPNRLKIEGFLFVRSVYAWINFPPARIDVFQKKK